MLSTTMVALWVGPWEVTGMFLTPQSGLGTKTVGGRMATKDTRSPTSWEGAAETFRHYLMPSLTPVPGQTLAIVSDIVQKARAQP